MTPDDLDKLDALRAKATPGPYSHEQPFMVLEKQRTIHGTVPKSRVDYVTGTGGKTIVCHREGMENAVRSNDMAYFAAIANAHDELMALARKGLAAGALREATEKARAKFYEYGELHDAKKTAEGNQKALANYKMAAACQAAIEAYDKAVGKP